MFYNRGEVISDQFEHLNMFSFWGNSENRCRGGGGFPYSHITLSQNVNIFVKTKNAQEALKHKINLKIFFVTWAFPYWGGGLTTWEKFLRFIVFCSGVPLLGIF